jgi:hypothetical protein
MILPLAESTKPTTRTPMLSFPPSFSRRTMVELIMNPQLSHQLESTTRPRHIKDSFSCRFPFSSSYTQKSLLQKREPEQAMGCAFLSFEKAGLTRSMCGSTATPLSWKHVLLVTKKEPTMMHGE